MPNFRTRDSIIGKPKKRRFDVASHPVFGDFRLRSLTALEANRIPARILAESDADQKAEEIALTNCRYVVEVVVNPEDEGCMFTPDDVAELATEDAAFINWLAAECEKHVGANPNSDEDASKNSKGTAI